MTCPICDNKPANCDCTERERWQHEEIERLTAELERHRMTEEERHSADFCVAFSCHSDESVARVLERYLGRTAPREEGDA